MSSTTDSREKGGKAKKAGKEKVAGKRNPEKGGKAEPACWAHKHNTQQFQVHMYGTRNFEM